MRSARDIYPALIEHEARCGGDTEVEASGDPVLVVSCVGIAKRLDSCDYQEEFTAT